MSNKITVQTLVGANMAKVWQTWNVPEDITMWCFASDDWYAPFAENDLRVGGKFVTTMSAKDGSESFDFSGVYTTIEENKKISYTLDDSRTVEIIFEETDGGVLVTETFEMENENTEELQRAGWQAILENFKKHAENK
jgi:uncharacterized protein YndB with AHSA1/START domain